MCGSPANSREHRYKKSELERAFLPLKKYQPSDTPPGIAFRVSPNSGDCYWVKGHNANSEKYPRLICKLCNNEKTQSMDNAYDKLSKWCWENPEATFIDLSAIWGSDYYKQVPLFYGYCLKILGCEILNSNALLPYDFPNPLNFVLENSNLLISICKAGKITALHPRLTKEMGYRRIGKGCLFGHKDLNNNDELKLENSKIENITDLVWFRVIGNFQINFWYNIEPNLCFGAIFDGTTPIYDVPDLGLDCFDMDYLMHATMYGSQRIKWLTKKAKDGHPWAQYKLALMYAKGYSVKRNLKKALKWYNFSAQLGNPQAMSDLGYMYFYGVGVQRDIEKAIYYWELAAAEDYPPAQTNLGFIFENGIGVNRDYTKATDLFRAAANKGHSVAQHNLGYLYANGLGVEENHQEAFRLYGLAAEQGYSLSQNNLGCMFASGIGADKDEDMAIMYLELAAEQGHISAQKNLEFMRNKYFSY